MNFDYYISCDQLYLERHSLSETDFIFLGIGFTKSKKKINKHISQVIKELDEESALKLLEVEASRYPNSSLYDDLHKLNPEFTLENEKELIFFGGSFNPWHEGHKACLDLLGNKKCIILPDRNPFKEIHAASPVKTYLEIIPHLNLDHHYLNPEFILKTNKNPTFNWIERTHTRSPQTKLGLLMGMDSLESIETWHKADDLLKLLNEIYVASRLEDESRRDVIKKKLKKYPELNLHFLGHHPHETVSSTELRKQHK